MRPQVVEIARAVARSSEMMRDEPESPSSAERRLFKAIRP